MSANVAREPNEEIALDTERKVKSIKGIHSTQIHEHGKTNRS